MNKNKKSALAGAMVRIVKCENLPGLVGKHAKISAIQDCPGKIKVDFDDQWQGYFEPRQLEFPSGSPQEIVGCICENELLLDDLDVIVNGLLGRCRQCELPRVLDGRHPCRKCVTGNAIRQTNIMRDRIEHLLGKALAEVKDE